MINRVSSTKRSVKGKNPGGRPQKFGEPSRPITVTLPESTLGTLRLVSEDRAQAIVKLAKEMRAALENRKAVELVEMTPNAAVIVVGPSKALSRIPFLHLVEVAPCRYILALDPGHQFKGLELAILDVLDEEPAVSDDEKYMLTELISVIRGLRKADRVSMAEILFVRRS